MALADGNYVCLDCYNKTHPYPTLESLRVKSNGATRMLYHLDYWDGPHSGIMLWNGAKAYFKSEDEFIEVGVEIASEDQIKEIKAEFEAANLNFHLEDAQEILTYRPFKVYAIPEDNLRAIEANHENFREHVGTHTDYDINGKRGVGATANDIGDLRPYAEHSKYYDTPKVEPVSPLNLEGCVVLGCFRIGA